MIRISRAVFPVYAHITLAVAAQFLVPSCYGADTAKKEDTARKYVEFARPLLARPDGQIRALALAVVLSDDGSGPAELACKALRDQDWGVRAVALAHLAGGANKECLDVVRELLAKNSHPNNALCGDTESIIAQAAARVLLASNDLKGRKQATDWIAAGLADPAKDLGKWGMAAELVGEYRLLEMKSHLSASKVQGGAKTMAAGALAKLGDGASERYLREQLNDPVSVPYIIGDFELVKLLKLSDKEIEKSVPRGKHGDLLDDEIELVVAQTLARLGYPERLLGVARQMRELLKADTSQSRSKLIMILGAIEKAGNASMIPRLQEFFSIAPDDWYKLEASLAIVKILQRENAKKGGLKGPGVESLDKTKPRN